MDMAVASKKTKTTNAPKGPRKKDLYEFANPKLEIQNPKQMRIANIQVFKNPERREIMVEVPSRVL